MGDTTSRDAIERSINSRLLRCDEQELRALDRMLVAIEKRRELGVQTVKLRDVDDARFDFSEACTYR